MPVSLFINFVCKKLCLFAFTINVHTGTDYMFPVDAPASNNQTPSHTGNYSQAINSHSFSNPPIV